MGQTKRREAIEDLELWKQEAATKLGSNNGVTSQLQNLIEEVREKGLNPDKALEKGFQILKSANFQL